MRRTRLVLAALAVLALAGCGAGPAGADRPPAGHDVAARRQLAAALPGLDDMPAGYAANPPAVDDPGGTIAPVLCRPVALPRAVATARADFIDADRGTIYAATAAAYRHGARRALHALRAAVDGCTGYTVTDHDTRTVVTVAPVSLPGLGTAAVAAQATARVGDRVVARVDMAYIAVGSCVASAMSGGPAGPDVELWEATAQSTVDRLRGAC